MSKRIYLTTAIPYVNAAPHVGHALELVQSDALARFYRANGDDVFWSWGADENSLKNVQAAEKEGVSVQQLVDKYAKSFEDLRDPLNLTFDIYNRTSSEDHFNGAQFIWENCKKDDIYKKKYTGLYCVGCEQFYTPGELSDGKCPEHLTVPETVEEENYFFRLSNYQKTLLDLIEKDKLKITPPKRKNEIISFIKSGLEDFSISRSTNRARGWGVPVPGDKSQVMYVWFDALVTYLTALGFPKGEKYKKYWVENRQKLHVIGKGINRFHTIYWPAMLLSAGISLPKEVFVHGYITVDGQKISKTLGNTIDPVDLVKKYGTDVVRYYFLREIPAWGDGDFSETRLKEIYNGELANGLGNTVARLARLAENSGLEFDRFKKPKTVYTDVEQDVIRECRFDLALNNIWIVELSVIDTHSEQKIGLSAIDQHINQNTPWAIDNKRRLKEVLQQEINWLRAFACKMEPFIPETAQKILKQFEGPIIKSEKPLFPRI